jgi:antagonist of KipI
VSTKIRVVQAGPLSTIQDCGRAGFQQYGVSVSGAMDQDALLLGNRLVGNDICAAAIEVTLGGAAFEFDEEALVAVTGGDLGPELDGLQMPAWTAVRVPAGSVVSFSGPSSGLRAYLCVAGGISTEPQLGSRSTHPNAGLGGVNGSALSDAEVLPVRTGPSRSEPGFSVPGELRPKYRSGVVELRVIPGPQIEVFSAEGVRTFYQSHYTIAEQSNRQGIRFDGPVIESATGRYDIVSDAVALGSVQVPGDGRPIVLMADRQTTGGYAKIGVVATVDLPLLAQAAPGQQVRFRRIEIEEAQQLLRDRRTQLLDVPLGPPAPGIDGTFRVEGVEYRVELGPTPVGVRSLFTTAEVAGQRYDVHAQQLELGDR